MYSCPGIFYLLEKRKRKENFFTDFIPGHTGLLCVSKSMVENVISVEISL
jgi:hypothetical protein